MFGSLFFGVIVVIQDYPYLIFNAIVNIFVFIASFIIWFAMKQSVGIRISEEAEKLGTDKVEIGVTAYMIRD